MKIKELCFEQIEAIYNDHMKKDFPPDELFPLARMKTLLARKQYLCLGLSENDIPVGYAFYVTDGSSAALGDYFAIFEKYRNSGLGTSALEAFNEYLSDFKLVLGEVEDPDYAADDNAKALMQRRIEFYRRNGLHITDIKVRTFGVNYLLIYRSAERHERDELIRLYQNFYDIRASVPLRKKHVKILNG